MSKKKNNYGLWSLVAVFVLILGAVYFSNRYSSSADGESDVALSSFAQCLEDKGARFYGAFWCSHCQDQKEMFGGAAKDLPYVECSTRDGKGQLPECQKNNISGYPTWEFADGSRMSGSLPLGILAEKSGCALPAV